MHGLKNKIVVFVGFHAYINEMRVSRSKIPSKNSGPYIYDVEFLALLGAPYIYYISRLRVKCYIHFCTKTIFLLTCVFYHLEDPGIDGMTIFKWIFRK
jgi:hypothetical protein